jgi:hypothetical protein
MKQVRNLITAWTVAAGFALLFTGCASTDAGRAGPSSSRTFAADHPRAVPLLPPAGSGKGAYYKDDGPGANPPPRLDLVPDAVFKPEPLAKIGNRRYSVFGATYTPLPGEASYSQRGVASWYGRKFHGHRTASGERYDMYKMTAAHPTLPIPSYVRVTNLDTGRHVTVRVNDRGPFLGGLHSSVKTGNPAKGQPACAGRPHPRVRQRPGRRVAGAGGCPGGGSAGRNRHVDAGRPVAGPFPHQRRRRSPGAYKFSNRAISALNLACCAAPGISLASARVRARIPGFVAKWSAHTICAIGPI